MSAWKPGDCVAIDRKVITEIERITPSGRVVADGVTFNPKGIEITSGSRKKKLEVLTPEIKAEMALARRSQAVAEKLYRVLQDIERWRRDSFSRWRLGDGPATKPDIETAERLLTAIQDIMGAAP